MYWWRKELVLFSPHIWWAAGSMHFSLELPGFAFLLPTVYVIREWTSLFLYRLAPNRNVVILYSPDAVHECL